MRKKIRNYAILALIILAFIVGCFDTMNGIFLAVFANTILNYIHFLRQRAKIVKIKEKKERALTIDEFRQREMDAYPHREYPNYNAKNEYKWVRKIKN